MLLCAFSGDNFQSQTKLQMAKAGPLYIWEVNPLTQLLELHERP